MWRSLAGCCLLALFVPHAQGQTYEELKKENEQLRVRLQALEAARKAEPEHKHDHPHEHQHAPGAKHAHDGHEEHGHHGHAGHWRWHDPYKPGWWKPGDEYRPYSWQAPPSEGFLHDLFCARVIDTHRNSYGTPWVHPFTFEPAQIHSDFFFFYRFTKNADGTPVDEHEAEFHVDWGLTRRFGIVIAAPYLGQIGPEGHATGFGDLEFAPRIVLVESEKFFLASNIAMTFPTGDEQRDLGRGEMTLAPFLTTWHDLGSLNLGCWKNWNQLQLNVGPEYGMRSGAGSLLYTVLFAHSFLGPKIILPHQHGHLNGNGNGHGNGHAHNGHGQGNGHGHHNGHAQGGTISVIGPGYPPGLVSLILELNGQSELQQERVTTLQLLTGFSYILTDSAELRFGVNFPLNRLERQMDFQFIAAFSWLY